MAAISNGFAQGFGLMNQFYNTQDNKQARADNVAFRDKQYADNQARTTKIDTERAEDRAYNRARDVKQDARQKSQDAIGAAKSGLTMQVKGKQLKNADKQSAMMDKQAKQDEDFRKFQTISYNLEGAKVGGNFNMELNAKLANELKGTQYGFFADALQSDTIDMVNKDLQTGRISKESLKLINQGGIPELKAAIGKPSRFGSPIVDVVMVGVEPKDEKLETGNIKLIVTDKANNTYESFINEDRDASSAIKDINLGTLMQHLSAQKTLLDAGREQGFVQYMRQHSAVNQAIGGVQGGDKQTAMMKNDQYLRQNYGDIAAENKLFRSRSPSAEDMYQSIYNSVMKAVSADVNQMQMSYDDKMAIVAESTEIEFNRRMGQQGQQGQQGQGGLIPQGQQSNEGRDAFMNELRQMNDRMGEQ